MTDAERRAEFVDRVMYRSRLVLMALKDCWWDVEKMLEEIR